MAATWLELVVSWWFFPNFSHAASHHCCSISSSPTMHFASPCVLVPSQCHVCLCGARRRELVVPWSGFPGGNGVGCTPLLLGERLHRPTDRRLVPGEGLGSPFRRCRRLSPIRPDPMELPSLLPPASWVSSRPGGVSVGWIALGRGLLRLQVVLVL